MIKFERQPQTYANHRKFEPLYHFAVFGAVIVNLIWSGIRMVREASIDHAVGVCLAAALVLMFFFMRVFALTVQDRVIRLEMRLRLRDLLPSDLRSRIDELTPGQLIALRFASDAELPVLVRAVLIEKLVDRDAIKRRVRNWQPDYLRC